MTTDALTSALIDLSRQLIMQASVTPSPCATLDIISEFCQPLGLYCKRYDHEDTANLFISTQQTQHVDLLFCGHVDVVPPGDLQAWRFPPFAAQCHDDKLYGRGAVDMKSSIAAFLIALKHHPHSLNTASSPHIAMLFTSDEEGPAKHGTRYVMQQLLAEGYQFSRALVGEPTSEHQVGDTIKTGRRGSLTGTVTITGTQSHAAYAPAAVNPIFALAKFIDEAGSRQWDTGHAQFSNTAFCPSLIHSDSGASNMTPAQARCRINFRYGPRSSAASLQQQVHTLLSQQALPFHIDWIDGSQPFYRPPGPLCQALSQHIKSHHHINCQFSTSGGTSDARFIATHVDEILELGPLNHTAHQIDEHISFSDLQQLYRLYQNVLMLIHAHYPKQTV